jgi:hypothetical protein
MTTRGQTLCVFSWSNLLQFEVHEQFSAATKSFNGKPKATALAADAVAFGLPSNKSGRTERHRRVIQIGDDQA